MKKNLQPSRFIESSIEPQQLTLKHRFLEGFAITCIAIGLFLTISMMSYRHSRTTVQLILNTASNMGGEIGYYMAHWLLISVGTMAYLLPPMFIYIGILSFRNRLVEQFLDWRSDYLLALSQLFGFTLIVIAGCGFNASFNFHNTAPYPGGLVGLYIDIHLSQFLGIIGVRVFLTALLLTGITVSTGISWIRIADQIGQWLLVSIQKIYHSFKKVKKSTNEWVIPIFNEKLVQPEDFKHDKKHLSLTEPLKTRDKIASVKIQPKKSTESNTLTVPHTFDLDKLPPPLTLLDLPLQEKQQETYSTDELETLSREIELRLKDFGILVTVVGVYPGPVVTRFEMNLAPGIKANRITVLATDLARSLSVISVRVVEIIPGKSFVGLELPNRHREIVKLREILDSPAYKEMSSPLAMALGKDIAGNPSVLDLSKMPHLLVAGTTGSGKSVGLNAMILSALYKATPDQVRLIMIDPKMLELSIYERIPHLLAPVVTDMKKAANALQWCINEMERRYQLMSMLGVRNLAGYNEKVTKAHSEGQPLVNPLVLESEKVANEAELLNTLPYILVLIDEFADMIMVVGKKVEELIARLAQKARAAGIHLILATQRPSVDVITGLIKANIPARIAFQVSSRIDSRTILDQQGAEQLLGHGDMLYMSPGTGVPFRIHGAFVADHEVHKVVEALKQAGPANYQIIFSETNSEQGESEFSTQSDVENDPLYNKAVEVVLETRRASISNVQRRLKIGYNRAATLLEAMEKAGIVSAMETNGKREVLVPDKM